MKTRNGFVSNSSTSSFIVGFPKDSYYHTSDIHQLLFPDKKYDDPIAFAEWSVPLYCVTFVLYKEIRRQTPITTKKAFAKVLYDSGGAYLDIPSRTGHEEVDRLWAIVREK